MESLMSRRQRRSELLRQIAEAKRVQPSRLEQPIGRGQGELQSMLVYEAEELERRAKQFEVTIPGGLAVETILQRVQKKWNWARQRIIRLLGREQAD